MNVKNVSVSGLVGGIVNFLLGWLFYGMLFYDSFNQPEEGSNTLLLIFLGCLVYSLFIAYIYSQWAQIKTLATGAKAGAVIGLFMGLNWNIWAIIMENRAMDLFLLDVAISVVMTAITGAAIGMVLGKLDK